MSGSSPIRTAAEATPIAEANLGLLYAALREYRTLWPNGDEDEALGIASLAYWRSCLAFDPASGTLGTLVFRAVRNGLLRAARNAAAAKRRRTTIPLADWDRPTAPAAPAETGPLWWLDLLTEEDRTILRLVAEGRTQEQVGASIGRSHCHVYHIMREVREALTAAGVTPESDREPPRRHRVNHRGGRALQPEIIRRVKP